MTYSINNNAPSLSNNTVAMCSCSISEKSGDRASLIQGKSTLPCYEIFLVKCLGS